MYAYEEINNAYSSKYSGNESSNIITLYFKNQLYASVNYHRDHKQQKPQIITAFCNTRYEYSDEIACQNTGTSCT